MRQEQASLAGGVTLVTGTADPRVDGVFQRPKAFA